MVQTNGPAIVWLRQDLRLRDNPALAAAVARGGPVIPVFILENGQPDDWAPGGASRWWLHHSLTALDTELRALGSRLTILHGPALDQLLSLVTEHGIRAVYWNRRYEPASIERDRQVKDALRSHDIEVESFNASLLFEPWQVRTRSGGPFRVFTPFKRALLAQLELQTPLRGPRPLKRPRAWPASIEIEALDLLPRVPWDKTMQATWRPGENAARSRLRRFLVRSLADYAQLRDQPGEDATSRLSPYLHFGEISPRQILHALAAASRRRRQAGSQWLESTFVSELVWREFSHHLLYHFPHTTTEPLNRQFERFEWQQDVKLLRAWQQGRTGYPMVDAGMRQLWATGWMHNRVRMIVASFLVKNLRMHWLEGARWFWDTLVDADLAANTLNWQWVAGSGADAAPYFRIFNPVTQGEKFDPDGEYVRTWVPELRELPAKFIHTPGLAPAAMLTAASVRLGENYPNPVVELKASREAALAAYQRMR